jgi:lysozyme
MLKMRLSPKGFDVLHEREGLELEAYYDTAEPPVLTIGLGHTSAAGPPKVYEGMVITEDEAEIIFRNDCETFREEVVESVKVELTQYEFDATCSFLYNIGSTNFLNSTFLRKLNEGDKPGAAEAMLMWNQPASIITRRNGEHQQFLYGIYVARAETPYP